MHSLFSPFAVPCVACLLKCIGLWRSEAGTCLQNLLVEPGLAGLTASARRLLTTMGNNCQARWLIEASHAVVVSRKLFQEKVARMHTPFMSRFAACHWLDDARHVSQVSDCDS